MAALVSGYLSFIFVQGEEDEDTAAIFIWVDVFNKVKHCPDFVG